MNIRYLWLKAIFNLKAIDYKVGLPILKSSNAEIENRYKPLREGLKTSILCIADGAYFWHETHQ